MQLIWGWGCSYFKDCIQLYSLLWSKYKTLVLLPLILWFCIPITIHNRFKVPMRCCQVMPLLTIGNSIIKHPLYPYTVHTFGVAIPYPLLSSRPPICVKLQSRCTTWVKDDKDQVLIHLFLLPFFLALICPNADSMRRVSSKLYSSTCPIVFTFRKLVLCWCSPIIKPNISWTHIVKHGALHQESIVASLHSVYALLNDCWMLLKNQAKLM